MIHSPKKKKEKKKSHISQMFNKCGLIYTIVTAEGISFLIFLSTYPPPPMVQPWTHVHPNS